MKNAFSSLFLAVTVSSLSIFPTFSNAEFFAYIPLEKSKGGILEDGAIKFNPSSEASGESEEGEIIDPDVLACQAKRNLAISLNNTSDLKLARMSWDKAVFGTADAVQECIADFQDMSGAWIIYNNPDSEALNRVETQAARYKEYGIYFRVKPKI